MDSQLRAYNRRYNGKAAYSGMLKAESRAESASGRAGALIIAYECPDCGRFHIGHADLSQRLAREVHVDRGCLRCGSPIHEALRQKAKQWGSPSLYCSALCRREAAQERRTQQRKQLPLPVPQALE